MTRANPNVKLTGDHNECPGCGELFNSTHAFECHRTGTHNRPRARRCLTVDEMLARGMGKNAGGWWVSEFRSPLVDNWPSFD